MGKFIDLTGQKVQRWTIIDRGKNSQNGHPRWNCICICGNKKLITASALRTGGSMSCGCLKIELHLIRMTKHGHANAGKYSPTYRSWAMMLNRCRSKRAIRYCDYGGRGIIVCKRWYSFENFLSDMGERPSRCSIDRYPNNDGNYEPGNCRWANNMEQGSNTRKCKFHAFNGETKHISEWARKYGIGVSTLSHRIRIGWSIEKALTTPVIQGH